MWNTCLHCVSTSTLKMKPECRCFNGVFFLAVNSNEQVKPRANTPQVRDTSPNKYLDIQKLHTAYAPKKNDNKTKNAILLPRVSNANLTKDNTESCTSSPRKQELEVENALMSPCTSSPQKLLNPDDDKVKKIFLSETHSGMIAGIPCAPPCTPTVGKRLLLPSLRLFTLTRQ